MWRERTPPVARQVTLPAGYLVEWSGEYENMLHARRQLWVIIPATLLLFAVLLYLNTHSWVKTAMVALAVPFSLIGAPSSYRLTFTPHRTRA